MAGNSRGFIFTVTVATGSESPDPLRLACTILNTDMDVREVELEGIVDTHEQGGRHFWLWALYLPWLKALSVSSLLVGLKKPLLRSLRHLSPGHMARQEAGAKAAARRGQPWCQDTATSE